MDNETLKPLAGTMELAIAGLEPRGSRVGSEPLLAYSREDK
jgi:hypothetical protein